MKPTRETLALSPPEARQESGARAELEALIEHMPAAVVVADHTGELRFANAMVADILGMPFEELTARWQRGLLVGLQRDRSRYPRDDWPLIRALASGEPVSGETIEIVRDDGSHLAIEVSATPVRDGDGRISAGIVSFQDVTERRRAELRERVLSSLADPVAPTEQGPALERLPALLVPAVADWCTVDSIDESGRMDALAVAHADPALAETNQELRRSGPLGAEHPIRSVVRTCRSELYADVDEALLARLARSPAHLDFLRGLGLRSWMAVPLVARNRVLGALALSTAESGRRLGRDDLRLVEGIARPAALALENAQLFARVRTDRDHVLRLLERLEQGVVAFDDSLAVQFSNPAARALLRDDLREGSPLPEPFDDLRLRELARSLFGRDAEAAHADVRLEDRVYTLAGIPAGDSARGMIVVTDVSERERREQAERAFVANAAHELQTPLTAIVSAAEVLDGGAKEIPEERDRFLAHIRRESNRLVHLSRALLVLARTQSHGVVPRDVVEVRPLLERVASMLQPSEAVAVEVECPEDVTVAVNRDLLEQAVVNLAGNAAKFTSEGQVVLRGRRESTSVLIEVEDTGPGIALAERKRVFDRFYRGNPGEVVGFGLGLTIVREAVAALGGAIELDAGRSGGTVARISIPAPEEGAG